MHDRLHAPHPPLLTPPPPSDIPLVHVTITTHPPSPRLPPSPSFPSPVSRLKSPMTGGRERSWCETTGGVGTWLHIHSTALSRCPALPCHTKPICHAVATCRADLPSCRVMLSSCRGGDVGRLQAGDASRGRSEDGPTDSPSAAPAPAPAPAGSWNHAAAAPRQRGASRDQLPPSGRRVCTVFAVHRAHSGGQRALSSVHRAVHTA